MTEAERKARMERALAYGGGTHRISDVVELIKRGDAQWWNSPSGDGMIVTQLETFPLFRAVRYWLIFGSLHDCLALEHDINPWAIEHGCTMAVATGRRGWGKVAAPTGWRPQPHMYNFFKPLVGSA